VTLGTGDGAVDAVAVRIAALCLDERSKLRDWLICGPAVRAGLLLDLALAGRIEQTDDSVVIDATPTGFAPADRLLAAVEFEPERSLDGWLEERRIGLRHVVDAAVGSGRWQEWRGPLGIGRRYGDLAEERTAVDRHRLPADEPTGMSPQDAAVTAIGAVAGLLVPVGSPERPSPAVVTATRDAAWLCEAVVYHLEELRIRYASQTAGMGSPF
jgi:hypothetical protein